MKSNRNKTSKGAVGRTGSGEQTSNPTQDPTSGKLRNLGKKLGNEALESRISDANSQQKNLLDFIIDRLQKVQQVQKIELAEMKDSRDWFKEVAKGEEGFTRPDTTRWHECARLYQRAAQALCRGDLGRGAALLEQAAESEKQAQEGTSKPVKDNLKGDLAREVLKPTGTAQVSSAAVCRAVVEPQELKIADQIQNLQDVMERSPPLQFEQRMNWWEEGTEEEEEEGDSSEE